MIKSMTAYAVLEKSEQELTVGIELRTYNSRGLDIALRIPPWYASLEEKIKTAIAAKLVRGRVEGRIWVKDTSERSDAYEVDMVKARSFVAAMQTLKAELQLPGEVTLEQLSALPGVMRPVDNAQTVDEHWPLIAGCLAEVLVVLDQMRAKEGSHTEADLAQRLGLIESQLTQIEQSVAGLLDQYREKLQARIDALTQGIVTLDPMRIAQEAALMADRSDISEEITRARSHIAQFRATMAADEPAGRKFNFLLQEFNREFNTMGSKVGQAEVAHIIVAVKTEIEKLREQVQNIE
ncbi:MAG: YicC family protein [Desulfobacteraceae bacterium]|nr:YicC family protein [Desulfobacteraceae bacterium]